MIYQLYAKPSNRARLFTQDPYVPFGLEPEVNPTIAYRCPELEDSDARWELREYAGMLHHWRVPHDNDDWIGFTSWRQLDKFPTVFLPGDRGKISELLRDHDMLGFAKYRFNYSLAQQTTACCGFPEFDKCLRKLVSEPPARWYTDRESCLYCNYVIMKKTTFNEYMAWSAPRVLSTLRQPEYRGTARTGNMMERLLIIWAYGKRVRDVTWEFSAGMGSSTRLHR